MTDRIHPFVLDVASAQLDDLHDRLSKTRWPERETVRDTSQGPTLAKVQALCEYWRQDYDWRRCESKMNAIGQFRTTLDGLDIHFIHAQSAEPDALPLLMAHGWPGSVLEFHKVIGPLTNPVAYGGDASDAFHVVAPSMPGFGFSGKPKAPGWNIPRVADAWIVLMNRLGYAHWGTHGGDIGAGVTDTIARKAPKGLVGAHFNFAMFQPSSEEAAAATPAEQAMLQSAQHFWDQLSGYAKIQSTRPQTIGYSLNDSPAGLAAWIYAMFQDTCGTPGNAEASFTYDDMLDDIMMYWLPGTGASSARIYWEMARSERDMSPPPVELPVGFSMYRHEAVRKSKRWIEARYRNLVHFNELAEGGHFAALEQPESLVAEIRTTFRKLRTIQLGS